MRPRQSRLGIQDPHDAVLQGELASMRPRQSRLGIMGCDRRGTSLRRQASMRPRQSRLGIEPTQTVGRMKLTRFNEAEAITPRNLNVGLIVGASGSGLQ